ncbi:MAG: 5-(carboxyamino)imidazole ribonucleotide synthase [bacterium]|nr:5-(carboxyamino)imidazole ribonucleotide synthase [bacterium]
MRIGVLGGGQLGRMLALAGMPLGHTFTFLEPAPESTRDLGRVIAASAEDAAALDALADAVDVVTYEFENVPVAAARALAARVPVHPPPEALAQAQDRVVEKRFLRALGVPTPDFAVVDDRVGLAAAAERLGLPLILKTRRFGYDGKGQVVVRTADDLDGAWAAIAGRPAIAEAFVAFTRELSVLAVRGHDGGVACWPLVENRHVAGVLRLSLAPAPDLTPALQALAEGHARRVLDALGYVGVLALELFQVGDALLANEMAPRVHNSGHWTIEGAATSQFENHVRAVTGAPLGATTMHGVAAMVNLIGAWPDPAALLAVPRAHLHLYGKAPRPGRKVGHVTLRAGTAAALAEPLARVRALADAAAC